MLEFISRMKRTESGLELETTEEIQTLFDAIEKSMAYFEKGNDEMRTKDGKILIIIDENYQKVQLSPDKIYFLSHPCTTGGGGEKVNREKEEEIYNFLIDECENAKIIRPLKIIPDKCEYNEAMGVCFTLQDVSHVNIFSPGWQSSKGCKDEHKRCIKNNIPRLYIVAENITKLYN